MVLSRVKAVFSALIALWDLNKQDSFSNKKGPLEKVVPTFGCGGWI
jgi:hypothetical protein